MSIGTQISIARALLNRWNSGPMSIRQIDIGDEDRALYAWEVLRFGALVETYADYGNAVKAMNKQQI